LPAVYRRKRWRIADLVGLVCGFEIGMHCRFQLSLLIFIGLLGYFGLGITEWMFSG
jgi:hypothetical protein